MISSMRTLKQNFPTIGVLAGWQTYRGTIHNFLASVYTGIRSAANDYQCNLIIGCGINSPLFSDEKQTAFPIHSPDIEFAPVGHWNTDGLIVIGPLSNPNSIDYLKEISKNGFPVVFAGDLESRPCVIINNEDGIIQAIDHLVFEHGLHKIAFLAGENLKEGDSASRLNGYQLGLARHNIPYDPDLVVFGMHTVNDSYHAAHELLRRSRDFHALIASNDDAAVGAIQAIHEAGLSVPQDIAVIGFDDLLQARAQIPLLTTVHHPMFETGYQSTKLLYQILKNEVPEDTCLRIPANLIVRESCGCLPGTGIYSKASPPAEILSSLSTQPDQNAAMVQILTEAIYKEMQRLTSQEVEYLCSRILDAFLHSLARGKPHIFHLTFQQILEHIANSSEDLYAWQKAISWLQEFLPSVALNFPIRLSTPQINDMLHQARIAISEVSRGQFSRLLLHRTSISNQIGVLTSHLFASKSENEIFDIFDRSLPDLNIQSALIAFYDQTPENEPGLPVADIDRVPNEKPAQIYRWSQIKTAQKGVQPRFATHQFPPPGLYPADRPFQLIVLPLDINEGLIGFTAFETAEMEPLGSIVRALDGALRNVKLYQEALAAEHMAEQARKEAEEANRLKSRFLSIVSHELRAPLNLIYGLSNIMLEQSQQINDLECVVKRKDLERIDMGAQHLESLIRDVIDLARSDMGQLKLVWETIDLMDILRAVSAIGEQWVSDKQLTWQVNFPEHFPHIRGDRTRLRQVMINLLNNAVKYTESGVVSLAAWVDCDWVTITVTDTGLGVPLEEQDLIFDEFHQSKRTTERGLGGMGLGLAICHRLVEMHGGEISLTSSGIENEGSTFILRLPYIQPVAQAAGVPSPETQAEKVLLLVDDLAGSEKLRCFLSQMGFQVESHLFEDHFNWLQWFQSSPPDKVVLNLGLTSTHGWEILKTLKENPSTQHIPVLFYHLESEQSTGSVLNLNLLTKPLKANQLANELISQGLLFNNSASDQMKSILIVDDNPDILDLHTRILKPMAEGYHILQARNGREALDIILSVHPALVLLDLIMPEMDGFMVLEQMQANDACRNIPVIVLTSQNLTEEDTLRLNRCATSVLSKGIYTSQETLEHISSILSRKHKLNHETQHLVIKAMAFIHANYKEPISRSDVASFVGVSERHVARCFQQGIGLSPMIYLNRYRVNIAKSLLASGQMNITNIALEVGFSTGGYFSRVFRQEVGCSPREYIQSAQSP